MMQSLAPWVPGLAAREVMGDPSPCWEGSDGPGAIITHAEWVAGAPGRSLRVLAVGAWFLLCPGQDPGQSLGQACARWQGSTSCPAALQPVNIFCSVQVIS